MAQPNVITIQLDAGAFLLIYTSGSIVSQGLKESAAQIAALDEYDQVDAALSNAAIDGMERLLLALACAGVDVTTPAFYAAIKTTLHAIHDNY